MRDKAVEEMGLIRIALILSMSIAIGFLIGNLGLVILEVIWSG